MQYVVNASEGERRSACLDCSPPPGRSLAVVGIYGVIAYLVACG